jgi:hypothetical protein
VRWAVNVTGDQVVLALHGAMAKLLPVSVGFFIITFSFKRCHRCWFSFGRSGSANHAFDLA